MALFLRVHPSALGFLRTDGSLQFLSLYLEVTYWVYRFNKTDSSSLVKRVPYVSVWKCFYFTLFMFATTQGGAVCCPHLHGVGLRAPVRHAETGQREEEGGEAGAEGPV